MLDFFLQQTAKPQYCPPYFRNVTKSPYCICKLYLVGEKAGKKELV